MRRRYSFPNKVKNARRAVHFVAALPALRLAHTEADEGDEQCRHSSDGEHGAPAVARSHKVVDHRREEDAEVVSGVHPRGALRTAPLGPFFGHDDAAQRPLAADADTGEKAVETQLPGRFPRCSPRNVKSE